MGGSAIISALDCTRPWIHDNSIFTLVLILVLTITSRVNVVTSNSLFNVANYGAKGDGKTDDSKAFLNAWNGACGAAGTSTLIVPGRMTFLLQPIIFNGPCKASSINVQVWGNIIAPMDPSNWKRINPSKLFLAFKSVNGLSVSGPGSIIGQGQKWWAQSCKINPRSGCNSHAPTLLSFYSCSGLVLEGDLKFIDSPQIHIAIEGCYNVNINNLKIKSPETSPNTDGIHIQNSHYISLTKLIIGTGDDCISIGDRTSNVNISTVVCGPGHGISIGSLGRGGTSGVLVKKIEVRYAKFIGTTNGARIKTWQGASGIADQIKFEHLEFFDVKNPIIIDQNYCDQPQKCKAVPQGVKISNVSYKYANGTSSTPVAINLNCDETVGCIGIQLQDINIKSANQGKQVMSSCTNSHGRTIGIVQPSISCLS